MLKQTKLLPLVFLTFLAACEKQEQPASEPPASPAAQSAAPTPAPTPAPSPIPEAGGELAQGGANGKKVYESACAVCHVAGIAGAPKLGDKALWGPRIAQGKETLYTHAIKGFQGKTGVMPPKGGNLSLSDADVKAAVDYMVMSVM